MNIIPLCLYYPTILMAVGYAVAAYVILCVIVGILNGWESYSSEKRYAKQYMKLRQSENVAKIKRPRRNSKTSNGGHVK